MKKEETEQKAAIMDIMAAFMTNGEPHIASTKSDGYHIVKEYAFINRELFFKTRCGSKIEFDDVRPLVMTDHLCSVCAAPTERVGFESEKEEAEQKAVLDRKVAIMDAMVILEKGSEAPVASTKSDGFHVVQTIVVFDNEASFVARCGSISFEDVRPLAMTDHMCFDCATTPEDRT